MTAQLGQSSACFDVFEERKRLERRNEEMRCRLRSVETVLPLLQALCETEKKGGEDSTILRFSPSDSKWLCTTVHHCFIRDYTQNTYEHTHTHRAMECSRLHPNHHFLKVMGGGGRGPCLLSPLTTSRHINTLLLCVMIPSVLSEMFYPPVWQTFFLYQMNYKS